MLGFFIGLFCGGFIGVGLMAICNAASKDDRYLEDMQIRSEQNNEQKSK